MENKIVVELTNGKKEFVAQITSQNGDFVLCEKYSKEGRKCRIQFPSVNVVSISEWGDKV